MKKTKVNLGCGIDLFKGFINIDAFVPRWAMDRQYPDGFPKGAVFLPGQAEKIPLDTDSVDYLETVDMIEHLPLTHVVPSLKEIHRVLKPGGLVRVLTPDFDACFREWLRMSEEITTKLKKGSSVAQIFDPEFKDNVHNAGMSHIPLGNRAMMVIYGNQLHPGEFHKSMFTPATMYLSLKKAGFKKENIKIIIHPSGNNIPRFKESKNAQDPSRLLGGLVNDTIVAEAVK